MISSSVGFDTGRAGTGPFIINGQLTFSSGNVMHWGELGSIILGTSCMITLLYLA